MKVSNAVRTFCKCVTQSLYCEAPRRSEGCVIYHTNAWREKRSGERRVVERRGEKVRWREEKGGGDERRREQDEMISINVKILQNDGNKSDRLSQNESLAWTEKNVHLTEHSPERSLTFECYYCFHFREVISVTLSGGICYFKCVRFSGWYFRYWWIHWNEVTDLDY